MTYPSLARYSNTAFLQFLTDTLQLLQQHNITLLLEHPSHKKILLNIPLLQSLLNRQKGSALSKELKLVDAQRDAIFIGLRKVIDGYQLHPDPQLSIAAKTLFKYITSKGKELHLLPYQEETAIIHNLLKGFSKDESLQNAIELLQLQTWIHQLSLRNATFEKHYTDRILELENTQKTSFTKEKKEVTKELKQLLKYIEAQQIVVNTPDYMMLTAALSELALQYNALFPRK